MGSFHRIQTEAWLKEIDVKAGRVLDVGAAQALVKGRTKSWDVGDYKVLDLPSPHEFNNPVDYEADLNETINLDGVGAFDVIFCIEVTEYWHDPQTAILNLSFLLKEGGILYITFPFVYGQHKPAGTDFLRYTPAGAEKLLTEVGFKILDHQHRYAMSGGLAEFYGREKMKLLPDTDHNIIGSMIKAIR